MRAFLTPLASWPPSSSARRLARGGYGDLLETLAHIYDAQKTWFDRAQTGRSGPRLDLAGAPDIPAVRAKWRQLDADMEAYIAGLDAAALSEAVSYRSYYGGKGSYTRAEMLLHQAFHAHQHRGELALLLTQLGHSPGELDVIDYLETRSEAG
jgi:uncharacterized damage-inducible protein DinB